MAPPVPVRVVSRLAGREAPRGASPEAASERRQDVPAHRAETDEVPWALAPGAPPAVPPSDARLGAQREAALVPPLQGEQQRKASVPAPGAGSELQPAELVAPRRSVEALVPRVEVQAVRVPVEEATRRSGPVPERLEPAPQQARPVSPLVAAQREPRLPVASPAG